MALNPLHLGVALDGYGWHPQAWRSALAADPVTGGRYWARLATIAEGGLLHFLSVDDSLDLRGPTPRADAVLVAARIAPVTRHIGVIPVATVTHTEPFHVSKAIATLDHISTAARAGSRGSVRLHPTLSCSAAGVSPEEMNYSTRQAISSRSSACYGTAGRTTP